MDLYNQLASLVPMYNLGSINQDELISWFVSINKLFAEHNRNIFILILHHYRLSLSASGKPVTIESFIDGGNRLCYGIRKIDNPAGVSGIDSSIKSTLKVDWANLPDTLIKIIIVYLMKYAFVNPPLTPGVPIRIK